MNLIQVVPDTTYFVWQLYVQMLNFREHRIERDAIILVALSVGKSASNDMLAFEKWTGAKVYYYPDTRATSRYMSSIRPHILAKHLKLYPIDVYLYHDQDIIFLEKPRFNECMDGGCYVAEAAKKYLDVKYLKQFKPYIFPSMCEIVGIAPNTVEFNDASCGGAQYIISGVDYTWWEKVERDCEGLYYYLQDITTTGLQKYKPDQQLESYHVQIWCADMWAVYWNLLLSNKRVSHAAAINFSWPWEKWDTAKAIMHNAGISENNKFRRLYDVLDKDGASTHANCELAFAEARAKEIGGTVKMLTEEREYFYKGEYNAKMPFGERFDFVSKDRVQSAYVKYIHNLNVQKDNYMQKRKILGVFCTTNNINAQLLDAVIKQLKKAQDATTLADIQIVTCSWKPIKDNPFDWIITPFNNMGHLNYILQIKQVLAKTQGDIVCILEHDVLYPDNYFDTVIENWDNGKYGLCIDNYIGMNETGYLQVKERHKPFSLMSFAKFYLEDNLNRKLTECMKTTGDSGVAGWETPFGWCCVEPDNKSELAHYPFTDKWPAIHVNMNHQGAWHSGAEGKNHHFTSHCEVCYEQDSNGVTTREDWGDYKQYYNFNL